jgi:RHS repeat-associated protein
MPELPLMRWDYADRLHATARRARPDSGDVTYYGYDAAGQRARKATDAAFRKTRKSERVYVGPFELYREYAPDGTLTLERETLHVLDGKQRIALVETRTAGTDSGLAELIRYQVNNHLNSSVLELDESAHVISYEEYFPYGSTSYQAVRSRTETPKRYRYTGRERDYETGLSYQGARYYASWLGVWMSCDPVQRGPNRVNPYRYCLGNPVTLYDPDGMDPKEPDWGPFIGPHMSKPQAPSLPFDKEGNLDPRSWPPKASYNQDDLKALRRTDPVNQLGGLALDMVTGLLGEGTASAPESAAVADRDRLDKGVTPAEQALNIALAIIPAERIVGWALKGVGRAAGVTLDKLLGSEVAVVVRALLKDVRGSIAIPFTRNPLTEGKIAFALIGESKVPLVLRNLSADAVAAIVKISSPEIVAEGLAERGTIASFAALSQATKGIGGAYQAHHIVEQKVLKLLGMPLDISPAVILRADVHAKLSAELAKALPADEIEHMTKTEILRAYENVYKDHPQWIAEVRRYLKR